MRRTPLALMIPMITWFGTACSDSSAPAPTAPVAVDGPNLGKVAVVPPVIDGVMTPGEYDGAATVPFRVLLPTTEGAQPATAYITHDKKYLYLAVTFDRKQPFHANDIVGFEFDNDNDGIREDGDDIVITSASIPLNTPFPAADFYRFNGGAANQSDAAGGGTSDVLSAWGTVGTKGVFEMRHDLDSADDAHDFSIDPSMGAVTLGMLIQVSLEANPVGSNVYVHTFKPSPTTYCKLTIAKKSTSVTCP